MLLSLSALLKFLETEEQRYLILSVYLFSLGLANHLTVLAMFIPIMFAMIGLKAPAKLWAQIMALFVVAISAYLYIPLRSIQNPVADWDHPATLAALIDHITAKRYHSFVSGIRFDNYFENLWRSIRILASQFPAFLGLLGMIGIVVHRGLVSRARLFLISIALFNLLTVALYDIPDIEQYYLPTLFVSAVGLSLFLKWLFERFSASIGGIAVPVVLALSMIATLGKNFAQNDQSRNRLEYLYGMNIFNSVPPGSILISVADNANSALYYLHYVERIRPDIEIYDAVKTYRMLRDRLHLKGRDRELTGQELCLQIMARNPDKSYLVKEHMLRKGSPFNYLDLKLTPRGLVYKWGNWPPDSTIWKDLIMPPPDSFAATLDFKGITMLCNLHLCRGEDLQFMGDKNQAVMDFRVAMQIASLSAEASVHNSLGIFLRRQGWSALAEEEYDKALKSEHLTAFERANILVNLGNLRKDASRLTEAIEYYDRALKINRDNTDASYNLALAQAYAALRQSQFRRAAGQFESALAISTSDPRLYFNLGVLYDRSLNDTTRAILNYRRFVQFAPNTPEGQSALQRIHQLRP
jgi:tetratricopeptide (TPR) repeat protein